MFGYAAGERGLGTLFRMVHCVYGAEYFDSVTRYEGGGGGGRGGGRRRRRREGEEKEVLSVSY
jgi:hypothetical protein